MENFRFTVWTPTFNRAKFLRRAYNSLLQQTYKDFEWLIVDDGSVDDTEIIVKSFIAENKLTSIKYIKKENGGKHTAWRVATEFFNATYVITLDSDDTLTPDALEVFNKYWLDLESKDYYNLFWEVKGRVKNIEGEMVGPLLPMPIFDSTYDELSLKYKNKAEMQGCRKASVLRNEAKVPNNFLFEENCIYLTESIRWSRAGRKYKTRFINEIVRTYYSDAEVNISISNDRKQYRNRKRTYSNLVAAKFAVEERRDLMLKWDKIEYIRNILVLLYTCFCLSENPFLVLRNGKILDKLLMSLGYVPMLILCKIRG